MRPYIIWADARSGSTALSKALRAIATIPTEDEPFQFGAHPNKRAWIYEHWCKTGEPAPLYDLLRESRGIKHIAEQFDDNFNAHIAQAGNHFGYRHIRLARRNVFAQLASRGIAEQLDFWVPDARRLSETTALAPLNIDDLLAKRDLADARWQAVSAHIPERLNVWTEDLTCADCRRRLPVVRSLLTWLDIPPDRLEIIDDVLFRSGQGTENLLRLVPNIGELLRAVG